jgi:hypothetical protein
MAKPRKSSSVPGQALGFSLQFVKMTELLVGADDDAEVEFEGLDDVSRKGPGAGAILELYQTKSALASNPIADRSTALWKCLGNWTDLVAKHGLQAENLRLVLFVSNPVAAGEWVNLFHSARNEADADEVVEKVRTALWGSAPDFALKSSVAEGLAPEVERFFGADESVRRTVVRAFSLEVVKQDVYADLAIVAKYVDDRLKTNVIAHACGWTKDRVDHLLAAKQPAVIKGIEFRREMVAYIRKFNERAILRSFAPAAPSPQETEQLRLKTFVRQLELISVDYADQLQAISDFHRAAIDRTQLGESGDVHPTSFNELDDRLSRSWKNISRQKQLQFKELSAEERGELVYRECISEMHLVEEQRPPEHFVPGCYHLLAEDAKLGWHPEFAKLLAQPTSVAPGSGT